MSNNHNQESELELDRHIASLRDEPIAAGPSPQAADATLAMLRSSEPETIRKDPKVVTSRPGLWERLVYMTFTQRLAAAVFLTLGGITLYVVFTLFSTLGATVAFADVARKFTARTMTFQSTTRLPGKPPITAKTMAMDPDRMRSELPGGMVSIRNGTTFLILNPQGKTAMVTTLTAPELAAASKSPDGLVSALRRLSEMKGDPLGTRSIDGIESIGFRAKAGATEWDIWADKKTAAPVRVETFIEGTDGKINVAMDHFEFDKPLDDSLFSVKPPEDYKLTTQNFEITTTKDIEQAVTEILKIYSDAKNGAFPESLQDLAALFIATMKPGDTKPNEKLIGMAGSYMALSATLECHYTGKGVKLGEKDKIVFWYRPEPKATKCRAIYGDLRAEDVAPHKVPATQP